MKTKLLLALILVLLFSFTCFAQKADPADASNAEKAQKILQQVIEARGGAKFLSYQTIQSSGQWSQYHEGMSNDPIPFIDYVIFPDKERTEFGKAKKKKDRRLNVNTGATGWVYDGEAETLKEQTPAQLTDFKESRESDLDALLKSAGTSKDVTVTFYGREETKPGERADVLTFKVKSGREFFLQIDPQTKLPMTLSYEKTGGEKGTEKYEFRFNQYVAYDGVKFPNIVDLYKDRLQISRVNNVSIKLDVPIPETLFVKPASAKEVK